MFDENGQILPPPAGGDTGAATAIEGAQDTVATPKEKTEKKND